MVFYFLGEEELKAETKALNKQIGEKYLDENEILAQAFVVFAAGYETTATTLSFCMYLLALNPEIQEKLYQELKSESDSNGEIPYDKLSKLQYLDAVLSETLRCYPAVKLGDTGITLFKGQILEIPYIIRRNTIQITKNSFPKDFYPKIATN